MEDTIVNKLFHEVRFEPRRQHEKDKLTCDSYLGLHSEYFVDDSAPPGDSLGENLTEEPLGELPRLDDDVRLPSYSSIRSE